MDKVMFQSLIHVMLSLWLPSSLSDSLPQQKATIDQMKHTATMNKMTYFCNTL